MLPKLKSLTNVLVLCCAGQMLGCNVAQADTELSGFVTNTTFSDRDWQDGRSVIAVNVDNMNGYLDIRGQLTSNENAPIRRATIGKTFHIGGGAHATIRAGRMSRVDSFFNNVVDAPANSGMAMLPLAGYNYRMFQGSFVLVDGVKADVQGHYKDNLFHAHWTHGYMVVTDQMNYQQEVLKKQVTGVYLKSLIGDTVEVHHERGNFHTYMSRTFYGAETELVASNTLSRYYTTNAARAMYDLTKYGIRYDDGEVGFVMLEHSTGYSHTYSKAGKRTSITDAYDQSATVGMYFGDRYSAYFGQSFGENLTAKTTALDNFVGLTKRWNKVTLSVDYHSGHGQGWMQYNAAKPYEWRSFVVSSTYQF